MVEWIRRLRHPTVLSDDTVSDCIIAKSNVFGYRIITWKQGSPISYWIRGSMRDIGYSLEVQTPIQIDVNTCIRRIVTNQWIPFCLLQIKHVFGASCRILMTNKSNVDRGIHTNILSDLVLRWRKKQCLNELRVLPPNPSHTFPGGSLYQRSFISFTEDSKSLIASQQETPPINLPDKEGGCINREE